MAHLGGLVFDGIKLACLVVAISLLQLVALLPPVRRLLRRVYDGPASEAVDKSADDGAISLTQRGQHYVNKSIDFEVMLRSTASPNFFATFYRWWREQRAWEAAAPLAGVSPGHRMRDGVLITLDGEALQLSSLVKPNRFLLINFGSCT